MRSEAGELRGAGLRSLEEPAVLRVLRALAPARWLTAAGGGFLLRGRRATGVRFGPDLLHVPEITRARRRRSVRGYGAGPAARARPRPAAGGPGGGARRRGQRPSSQRFPNVVILTIDTLRADRLSSYGYRRPTTPNLDRLLASGVRFTQARTVEPLTNPALCSMFTSLYPHEHGATRNGLRLRPDATSAARVLGQRGYRSAAFVGNWTLRNGISGLGDHFQTYDEVFSRKRWFGLFKGEATAEDLTDAALAWLEDHRANQRRPVPPLGPLRRAARALPPPGGLRGAARHRGEHRGLAAGPLRHRGRLHRLSRRAAAGRVRARPGAGGQHADRLRRGSRREPRRALLLGARPQPLRAHAAHPPGLRLGGAASSRG